MESTAESPNQGPDSLRNQVRSAVIWRSGTQILGQLITWASTFLVIRILSPADYGLFAMTSVVLVLLNIVNGFGFANAVIREEAVERRQLQQLLGMLIVLNLALAATQLALAPLAAAYYREPMVASLLRVQALLYLTTPPIALAYAVLSRAMDFRHQAQVNLISGIAGAAAALAGALAGLGVWTLVLAPLTLFAVRALGLTIAARTFMLPRFDFRGAGWIARYGAVVGVTQVFWFLQTQADIFIAGRIFSAAELGLYTTALFLTQMFVTKFVPPINEVAFSAYSRIRGDHDAYASAFLKGVRIIFVIGLPFYAGMAVTAEPLVHVVLGEKWLGTAPLVRTLAFAMPFMTLIVLFTPALEALGRPDLSLRNSMVGSVMLPVAFLIGAHSGAQGLTLAWVAAYPMLVLIAAIWTLPALEVRLGDLADALRPSLLAALGMAVAVLLIDREAMLLAPLPRLAIDVVAGAAVYGLWLLIFARDSVAELLALARREG
ncbi:lipopolysaccharide biosynthesis protein [Stakelama tenebrarum]|uniref:lipopolysaccharide biosynthesis protein n=1 Tax=Stakelama tenebrarum TaxID=2711215 RepID=UPI0038999FFD